MAEQPNILLLMTDQQRFDSLGITGCQAACTPNLDRLARQGVRFNNCYANNPICTPSRASMMTGKQLPGHGVYKLYDNLPLQEILFPSRLRDLGYSTSLFGKLHVSSRTSEANGRHPNDGFDEYEWCLEHNIDLDVPHNGYGHWLRQTHPHFYQQLKKSGRKLKHVPREVHMTHWVAERAIDFISRQNRSRPFFCMASVFDPHNPYEDFPIEMAERINTSKISNPIEVPGEWDELPILRRLGEESGGLDPISDTGLDWKRKRLGYHASIAFIDLEFGRILDALEQHDLANNTMVLFVSDHGDMLGDHGFSVKGGYLYDPCVRVPLIIRWPDQLAGGQVSQQLVQPHDLAATVLAAASMTMQQRNDCMPDSIDLIALANDKTLARRYAYCLYRNSGLARHKPESLYLDPPIHATMIRDEQYKLIYYHDCQYKNGHSQGQLFDMIGDPNETANLWNDHRHIPVRQRLTEAILDFCCRQELSSLGSRGGQSLPSWWNKRTKYVKK